MKILKLVQDDQIKDKTPMAYDAKIRLHVDCDLPADGTIMLDKESTHYLANVMRIKVGEKIALFNGRDGEWQTEVAEASRKSVTLAITKQLREQKPEPDVWLVFAPIKKARVDFIAQKATELGVAKLVPMVTSRTIIDKLKTDRLAANAREAAEQCERLNVPECADPVKIRDLLADWPKDRQIMFCDEDLSGKSAVEILSSNEKGKHPWAIFIGPEGGFDDDERALISNHTNCHTVSLGPRILRADTAAMAALSIWQSTLGDWCR